MTHSFQGYAVVTPIIFFTSHYYMANPLSDAEQGKDQKPVNQSITWETERCTFPL